MAQTKLGNLDIQYDALADVLYCSFGPPQEAIGEEISEGVIVRKNPESHATVGITFIDFVQRFRAEPERTVSVPLGETVESVA